MVPMPQTYVTYCNDTQNDEGEAYWNSVISKYRQYADWFWGDNAARSLNHFLDGSGDTLALNEEWIRSQ